MHSMQSKLAAFLESQRRGAQWDFLLRSLVLEASVALGPEQARGLLVKAGMRAGQEIALPECDSLAQMEAAANRCWRRLGLGVVSFIERSDCLEIVHEGIPSDERASESGLADFLAGLYQQWFVSLGAGERLQVKPCDNPDRKTLLYRLAAEKPVMAAGAVAATSPEEQ